MPRKAVGLHEDALSEAQAAYDWYAAQDPAAAEAFIGELDHAIKQIETFPSLGGAYHSGTRRFVLKRFPFAVIYRERHRITEIIAVAHARRKPGYWKRRIAN